MELAQAAAEYMAGIAPRFQRAGYELTANVAFENGVFAGVARREKGEVTRLGVTRNLFLLSSMPAIDQATFTGSWWASPGESIARRMDLPSLGHQIVASTARARSKVRTRSWRMRA